MSGAFVMMMMMMRLVCDCDIGGLRGGFALLRLHSWGTLAEEECDGLELTTQSGLEMDLDCRSTTDGDVLTATNNITGFSGSDRAQLHVEIAGRLHVGWCEVVKYVRWYKVIRTVWFEDLGKYFDGCVEDE
jgi:hypothetical protein